LGGKILSKAGLPYFDRCHLYLNFKLDVSEEDCLKEHA